MLFRSSHPALSLDKYVGSYIDSTYGIFEVTNTNAVLHARFEKADFGDLDHVDYDTFRTRQTATQGPVPIVFVPDGRGNIGAVRTFGVTFTRTAAAAAAAYPVSGLQLLSLERVPRSDQRCRNNSQAYE